MSSSDHDGEVHTTPGSEVCSGRDRFETVSEVCRYFVSICEVRASHEWRVTRTAGV